MNKTTEFLLEVKNLILNPKHWTKYASAKVNDEHVFVNNPDADCWCLLGAVGKVNYSWFCTNCHRRRTI